MHISTQTYKNVEENSNKFIKIEGRITTQLSNLASSSQHQSPLYLMKSKITPTIQCSFSTTNYQHFLAKYKIPASRSLK